MSRVSDDSAGNEAGERLEWRVWPAAERPLTSVGVAVFGLGLGAAAIWSFGSAWYGFITLAVLTLALAPHYFPTRYRLDDVGVHVRNVGENTRRWDDFQVAHDLGPVIVLGPGPGARSWRRRRGALVLRVAGQHDAVLTFVARHVAQVVIQRSA